jgi:hypothetical protein
MRGFDFQNDLGANMHRDLPTRSTAYSPGGALFRCFLAALWNIALAPAFADSIGAVKGCKSNPAVAAACFTVRGRMSAYNGTPSLRIWPIGSRRLLGVLPAENEIVPDNLKGKATFKQSVFATFEVCPFAKHQAGTMQFVCVESATDITVGPYR